MKLKDKAMIGMVHVRALPGCPKCNMTVTKIIDIAVKEAKLLEDCGFDAVILENMHDVPYMKRNAGEEITAAMSVVGYAVRKAVNIPIGIQILAGANIQALAVAKAAGLDFIRAEGFVFAHTADEGIMQSDAGKLLRYRKAIDAEEIDLYCDIKKKHSSHSITADTGIVDTAEAAEFFLADGVIITGTSTGKAAQINELKAVKEAVNTKVLIGSGITPENLKDYWECADGFIIGSYIKDSGKWDNEISRDRCEMIISKAMSLRSE